MASKLALALRREAAAQRILEAARAMNMALELPAAGKADPDTALVLTLEAVADALEAATPAAPQEQVDGEPKKRRG